MSSHTMTTPTPEPILQRYPSGQPKLLRAEITTHSADLHINAGETDLFDSEFDGKPNVRYHLDQQIGLLDVNYRGSNPLKAEVSQAKLAFSPLLPLNLRAQVNGGTADIRLAGLRTQHIALKGNLSRLRCDLSGDFPEMETLGVGVDNGNLSLRMHGAFGSVDQAQVVLNRSYGVVDLRGPWLSSQMLRLTVNWSSLVVLLPLTCGVTVMMRGSLRRLITTGLIGDRGRYVNRLAASSQRHLRLTIDANFGRVIFKNM